MNTYNQNSSRPGFATIQNNSRPDYLANQGFLSSINWKYIIYSLIFIAVVYFAIKGLDKFNKIFGPTIDGIADILGSAAKGLASLTNDCIEQEDCDAIKIADSCNVTFGCSYDIETNKCVIVSGRKAGEGGFTSCGFGIGLITYGVASLIFGIVNIAAVVVGMRKTSPAIEDYAMRSGKSNSDVLKEMFDKSMARSVEAEKTFKENNSREMTDVEKKIASSETADRVLTNKTIELTEKINNATEKKARMAEVELEYKSRVENREKEIKELKEKRKITDDAVSKIKDSIKEPKPKFDFKI